jgi:hypothetical protein
LQLFFLIDIMEVESSWVHSVTAATNRPIVPAPDNYDDGEIGGMMIGKGN